jgi:hypothetical protein
MAGSHHFVHLVMRLSAEVVRTRMDSGASPHHRMIFCESGNRAVLTAHHHFGSRTPKDDPVMW